MIDFNQPQLVKPIDSAGDSAGAVANRDLRGLPLSGLLRSINHVIAQQDWARQRLLAHRGKTVRLGVDNSFPLAPFAPNLATRIGEDGLLHAIESGGAADVSLWLKPSLNALFAGLQAGPAGLSAHLRIEGDVLLAGVMGELAQNLRWDAEEDLSRVVGDVGAHRAVNSLKSLGVRLADTRARVQQQAGHWLHAEQGPLIDRAALSVFAQELAELRRSIVQLEQRISPHS